MTSLEYPLRVLDPTTPPGQGPGRGSIAALPEVRALPARLTTVHPPARGVDTAPPRVLLVTEGTYPFQWGGVSTWCEALVAALPEVSFSLLAVEAYESPEPVFALPENVVELRAVPLWGLQDVKETWRRAGAAQLHASRRAVTDDVLETEFLPALRGFLRGILAVELRDQTCNDLARDVHAMYRFLATHDLNRTLRSGPVWRTWVDEATVAYRHRADPGLAPLALWELTTGFQWLSRWLFPLAQPLPQVDVVHAAMAGICSMVACVVKIEHGAGFFLTEHGVYLRERYLAEADRTDSHFLKLIGLSYARRMTEMSYELADQISPCCDYNQRWELEVGATPAQLETIYYGVAGDEFAGPPDAPSDVPRCVVWVGRINPLKDVETLLRAAAVVVRERPDVRFRLYGSAPPEDAEYNARCLALHAELGLQDAVEFCGYTDSPADAYREGDIVVLSSVSEGFPYSTLEAMLCGRPIVATSVGGIPEQIEGAGIAVEPRDPAALADGLLALLNDPPRCRALGLAARERAAGQFAASRFRGAHYSSYLRLSPRHAHWQPATAAPAVRAPATARAVPPSGSVNGSEQSTDALAEIVRRRAPHPVDALEVAAVLESAGVTDAVAAETYGHRNSFRLAETVFDTVVATPAEPAGQADTERAVALDPAPGSHLDTARHPLLTVLPSMALIGAIWAVSRMGGWHGNRVLALTIGMTVGMLSSNGLTLAMGRRSSTLISLGRIAAARRFFAGCAVLGVSATALAATSLLLLDWEGLAFLSSERATFVFAALALAAIWLLAAALSLLSVSGWTGVSLTVGLLVLVALDKVLRPVTATHTTLAAVGGLATVLALMVLALERSLRARPTTLASAGSRLPSRGYLLLEGLPYFVYGTFGVFIFFSVHVIGWAHLSPGSADLTTLELGLFLPLAPTVLGSGRAERSLRLFWVRASLLQTTITAETAQRFGAELGTLYRQERRRYLRSLTAMSLWTLVIGESLILSGKLRELTHYSDTRELQALFLASLLAYALLGSAQFSAMFGLSWGRCTGPLQAVLTGAVVTILLGWWFASELGYAWLGAALLIGGACYALISSLTVRRLFVSADYYYVMAL